MAVHWVVIAAAVLLKLHAGETIKLRDRSSNASLTFEITGLFAERQLSGPAASYWGLNTLPASGSSTASGFVTYGPLVRCAWPGTTWRPCPRGSGSATGGP